MPGLRLMVVIGSNPAFAALPLRPKRPYHMVASVGETEWTQEKRLWRPRAFETVLEGGLTA